MGWLGFWECYGENRFSGDNTRMETDHVLPLLNNWSALNEALTGKTIPLSKMWEGIDAE
jgi:hypothetical protein